MAAGIRTGLVETVRYDLRRMHETWMEVIYPRQRGVEHSVLGKWTPQPGIQSYLYRLWAVVGAPAVALVYPFVLLGFVIRFQTRRISAGAARIGAIGVVVLVIVVWGGLALLAKFRFSESFTPGGVTAVVAASAVAIVAALLAYLFWQYRGRGTTVVFAYPLAVIAIFLPPVVAALFSTTVANVILDRSDSLAHWFVFNGPDLFGVIPYLVDNFDRTDFAHVIIWLCIAIPVGWILGTVVTLADLVRPTPD